MPAGTPPPLVSPIVLMYHRVCADQEWRANEFIVSASVFRAHMRYLSDHGYYTPRLSDVLAAGGRAPRGPRSPVVLTFDDGYADNLEHALPVLRELGFTAAFFPVLDLERRFNFWDSAPEMRAPLLAVRELRALEDAGMELGTHTITHPWLTRVDDARLADELARSREVLASIAAHPLPVIAYPFGGVNARVKRAAHAAGYAAGLAVNSGPLDMSADLYEIRRQRVSNGAILMLILSGTEKVYAWSKWRVRNGLASIGALGADRGGAGRNVAR